MRQHDIDPGASRHSWSEESRSYPCDYAPATALEITPRVEQDTFDVLNPFVEDGTITAGAMARAVEVTVTYTPEVRGINALRETRWRVATAVESTASPSTDRRLVRVLPA